MEDHIKEILNEDFDNPTSLWEWVKYKIRQFCIKYSNNYSGSPDIIMEVASIKRELTEIKIQQANRIIFRSRATWAMAGEKPSAYFLGLEKRQRKANIITAIKDNK